MKIIWENYIDPFLPSNVVVEYVTVPIRSVWEILGKDQEDKNTENVYSIYSDPEDLGKRFSEAQFMKYTPDLLMNGQIIPKPIERSSTVDVSGTKIRQAIASRDKELFLSGMPPEVDRDAIWDILVQRADERTPAKKKRVRKKKNESVIKEAVEGMSLDDVVEEFFEEFDATKIPLTRRDIGETLRDYKLNNAENMKFVLKQLRELGVGLA